MENRRDHLAAKRLGGLVALVTGASSGIGEATAQALATEGAAVALLARRADRLERLAGEITAQNGRALVIETDVTDEAQALAAVERAATELGRLDIVVNNAGVMLLGPIEGAPLEEWRRMIDVNVRGFLSIAHAALPYLLRAAEDSPRRVADLINISSVGGRRPRRGSGVYNLTKFGVGAFSESLRQEVAARHVRVALIEPGAVKTELRSHLRPEIEAQTRQRIESMQLLEAEDIADAIIYIITRPRHVAINELLVLPTEQEV